MRALDRLICLLAGLALACTGGLLVIETILVDAGRGAWLIPRHGWDQQLRSLAWDDNDIRTTSIALLVVGAVILAAQLVPRRPLRLPLHGPSDRTVWLSRGGLQRRLERITRQDPDVDTGRVRVGRRRARIDIAHVQGANRQALARRLDDCGRRTVHELGLTHPPRLRFRYRAAQTRVR